MYSSYGIRFHGRSGFSLHDGSLDKNVITFGVDMNLSVDIENREKDIIILGIGSTQELYDTT